MIQQAKNKPKLFVQVTRKEYEQFMNEPTFVPTCTDLDDAGMPVCGGDCPHDLVCTMFSYEDKEKGVVVEWHACSTAEQLALLANRATPFDRPARAKRHVKYIAYCLE